MNRINDDKLCCLPFWNQIASRQQGQVGYRRRNLLANSERLPTYKSLPTFFVQCHWKGSGREKTPVQCHWKRSRREKTPVQCHWKRSGREKTPVQCHWKGSGREKTPVN
ncbi:MAG: hypothetical protein LBL62_06955 [Planctomycetaceae bacterium]|nr:hypothetical protein [Planctomycetaceae bacterium]